MSGIQENTAVIILAAGKGTRMKSERAKVLHELNAVPMIHYVVRTALALTQDHVHIDEPKGYGRVIINENGEMEGVVEEADADYHQRKITLINSGIYCVRRSVLAETLNLIRDNNAQKEFYLTDIIGVGYQQGFRLGVEIGDDPHEVIGINTLAELERAEKILSAYPGETACVSVE